MEIKDAFELLSMRPLPLSGLPAARTKLKDTLRGTPLSWKWLRHSHPHAKSDHRFTQVWVDVQREGAIKRQPFQGCCAYSFTKLRESREGGARLFCRN